MSLSYEQPPLPIKIDPNTLIKELFRDDEWEDILSTCAERECSPKSLIRDATMNDLAR